MGRCLGACSPRRVTISMVRMHWHGSNFGNSRQRHVRSYRIVLTIISAAVLGRLRSNLVSQSAVPWEVPNHDIMLTEWPAWVDEPLNG